MKIDLTLRITPEMAAEAQKREAKALTGHLGTHFDSMGLEFPLEDTERRAVVFDVARIRDRDIEPEDIELTLVGKDMFVAFHSGFIEEAGYGSQRYFREHPQLSDHLIDALIARGVSIIGLDFAGMRRGSEHTPKDRYCADRGVFVVENLCHLQAALDAGGRFLAHTYPMNYADMTGLPCRVIAEV